MFTGLHPFFVQLQLPAAVFGAEPLQLCVAVLKGMLHASLLVHLLLFVHPANDNSSKLESSDGDKGGNRKVLKVITSSEGQN